MNFHNSDTPLKESGLPTLVELRKELMRFIAEAARGRVRSAHEPRALTVGVEHEFFLCRANGIPSSHEESQAFLRHLASTPGWAAREIEWIHGDAVLLRVSREEAAGRFTAVKYDHHPHLMEIALGYKENVADLHRLLEFTLNDIQSAANRCGLHVSRRSFIDCKPDDPRIISPLPAFEELRSYREHLFRVRGERPVEGMTNYAAVIAATQTHIGGIDWLRAPELVSCLYAREPEAHLFAARGTVSQDSRISSSLAKRWLGYRSVFRGYPLVGFPEMVDWNLEAWIGALFQMPLSGPPQSGWAGRSIQELGLMPFSSWTEFLSRVRDLQIIRPRVFGTLEFRADPAQPSASRIVAVAALRLANCVAVLSGAEPERTFPDARAIWEASVSGKEFALSDEYIRVAEKWLAARGFGEEKFLEPLYEPEVSSAA